LIKTDLKNEKVKRERDLPETARAWTPPTPISIIFFPFNIPSILIGSSDKREISLSFSDVIRPQYQISPFSICQKNDQSINQLIT
jgi:hypothetical protein